MASGQRHLGHVSRYLSRTSPSAMRLSMPYISVLTDLYGSPPLGLHALAQDFTLTGPAYRASAACIVASLTSRGPQPSTDSQWSHDLPSWLLILPVLALAALAAAYVYGIPLLATAIAMRLPATVTDTLGRETMAALDRQVFTASAIPHERQQSLEAAFRQLTMPRGSSASYRLEFRQSDEVGANAMALPSGTIVVTDGLLALAKDDREILGVLAHEAGHVERRHGLRGIVQNSLMGIVVAWIAGDVSALAPAAASALLEASYSRDLEREADTFAVEVMRANDIPLENLANILRRLESSSGATGTSSALRYLSTHPATAERIAQMEGKP